VGGDFWQKKNGGKLIRRRNDSRFKAATEKPLQFRFVAVRNSDVSAPSACVSHKLTPMREKEAAFGIYHFIHRSKREKGGFVFVHNLWWFVRLTAGFLGKNSKYHYSQDTATVNVTAQKNSATMQNIKS